MRRKLMAGLLVLTMMVGGLTGCGASGKTSAGSDAATGSTAVSSAAVDQSVQGSSAAKETTAKKTANKKPYKIAVGLPDSGSTMFSLMSNNVKTFVESTGGKVVFQGGVGASADATIQFVEDQIAAGANGIIISPPADSVLPTVSSMCEEAGVYWGITFRTIKDQAIKSQIESSKYYVGNCFEDEANTGYQVMTNLNKLVVKKIAIISQAKGNTTTDLREEGINKACEQYGMKVVTEARSLTQASDATSATESFLSAYPDLDCVFIVGTTGTGMHEAVAKAIKDAGRQDKVKMATIDFPDSMVELFKSGMLDTCSGLPSWGYDPFMITTVLANKCMGTPISETPVTLTCSMFDISDTATAEAWTKKFGEATTLYYDKDTMLKTFCKSNNKDLNADFMEKSIKEFTENAIK